MILLDTHVVVWLAEDSSELGAKAGRLIDEKLASDELLVASISFWEVAMLAAKGRLELDVSASALRRATLERGVREVALTGDTAILAAELVRFHGDPADRIITASAIAEHATLVTADTSILRWKHALPRHNARR